MVNSGEALSTARRPAISAENFDETVGGGKEPHLVRRSRGGSDNNGNSIKGGKLIGCDNGWLLYGVDRGGSGTSITSWPYI